MNIQKQLLIFSLLLFVSEFTRAALSNTSTEPSTPTENSSHLGIFWQIIADLANDFRTLGHPDEIDTGTPAASSPKSRSISPTKRGSPESQPTPTPPPSPIQQQPPTTTNATALSNNPLSSLTTSSDFDLCDRGEDPLK